MSTFRLVPSGPSDPHLHGSPSREQPDDDTAKLPLAPAPHPERLPIDDVPDECLIEIIRRVGPSPPISIGQWMLEQQRRQQPQPQQPHQQPQQQQQQQLQQQAQPQQQQQQQPGQFQVQQQHQQPQPQPQLQPQPQQQQQQPQQQRQLQQQQRRHDPHLWPVHHPLHCAFVCRHWRPLADPALVSLAILGPRLDQSLASRFHRRFPHLTSLGLLALSPFPVLELAASLFALEHLPALNELTILSNGGYDISLHALTQRSLTALASLHHNTPFLAQPLPLPLPWVSADLLSDLLRELVLQDFRAALLPDSLGEFSRLTRLDLLDCPLLASLPEAALSRLVHLRVLSAQNCLSLERWPGPTTFAALRSLHTLVILDCRGIPRTLAPLESLQHLAIRSFWRLPEDLPNLPGLTHLELSNGVSDPEFLVPLDGLCGLQTLRLSSFASLASVPQAVGALTALSCLEIADCGNGRQGSFSLPDSLSRLVRLRACRLDGLKHLAVLPDGIGEWRALTRLEIVRCDSLTALPTGLGAGLTALRELHLEGCLSLVSLPESVEGWGRLTQLLIVLCDALGALPDGLGGVAALEDLRIWACPSLVSLPRSLGSLGCLRRLEIVQCERVIRLPDTMEGLTALRELLVVDCSALEPLPDSLLRLSSLSVSSP